MEIASGNMMRTEACVTLHFQMEIASGNMRRTCGTSSVALIRSLFYYSRLTLNFTSTVFPPSSSSCILNHVETPKAI